MGCSLSDGERLDITASVRALEGLDTLGRDLEPALTLSASEVFRWVTQQRERRFGIFGRPLLSTSARAALDQEMVSRSMKSEARADVLMYRGRFTQRVSWLSRSTQRAPHLQRAARHDESPRTLQDLAHFLIVIERVEVIHPDITIASVGSTRTERRVYSATSPYELVSLDVRTQREAEAPRHDSYQDGMWTLRHGTQEESYPHHGDLETLISARLPVSSLHIGGVYHLTAMERGRSSAIELRVLDRRFEDHSGLWSEVSEVEVRALTHTPSSPRERSLDTALDTTLDTALDTALDTHIKPHGSQPESQTRAQSSRARFTFTHSGILRSGRLSSGLILAPRTSKQIKSREHLPITRRPLELSALQGRRGSLAPDHIRRALLPLTSRLNACHRRGNVTGVGIKSASPVGPTLSPLNIHLRLDLNAQGKLLAASATHQSPWPVTRCVLSALKELRLSMPQGASPRVAVGASLPAIPGAMISYLLRLPLSDAHLDPKLDPEPDREPDLKPDPKLDVKPSLKLKP